MTRCWDAWAAISSPTKWLNEGEAIADVCREADGTSDAVRSLHRIGRCAGVSESYASVGLVANDTALNS